MSQYQLRHNHFFCQYGWDSPLKYYFLTIFTVPPDTCDFDDEDCIVFSNLGRENPAMSIEEISNKLTEYGIPVPSDLKDRLESDSLREVSKKSSAMLALMNHFSKS